MDNIRNAVKGQAEDNREIGGSSKPLGHFEEQFRIVESLAEVLGASD
jgi:hypothetical protein